MNLLNEPSQYLLTELDFSYDVKKLIPLLEKVNWDDKNRCDLNSPLGHWLYDPYEIKEKWKDTAFEELLESIPYPVGEARLMRLSYGNCYSSHADIDDRLHLNLVSNDQSYLIDLTDQRLYPLVTDNKLYYMDGGRLHTATNFGSTDRIQLVIRVPLKRYTGDDFITRKIQFTNPVFNLRYILDNYVSPYINRAIKNGDIGYFNPISDTDIEFHLRPNALDELLEHITKIHKWVIVYD